MKTNVKELIAELCAIPGPAGFEDEVAKRVHSIFSNMTTTDSNKNKDGGRLVDEVWTDVLGNVIAVKRCGKENAKKLLFDAHIDEIGFIVTGIEEGFLRFSKLGGFDARIIPATGVTVCSNPPVYGVISVLPPHILKKEDTENNFKIEDLFIDVGLTQDEATKHIPIGTYGVLSQKVRNFGEGCICGKAIDDRAGLAAIMLALEYLENENLGVDLYVMASVQEEVGSRGATAGSYSIDPDYCVVVDVDHAKTPDTKPTETVMVLGDGAIISKGPNMNPMLTEKIIKLAEDNNIKHQINVIAGNSGTNARAIQISKSGTVTAVLGLPMKYMHSANETISLDDVEAIARLLCSVAKAV